MTSISTSVPLDRVSAAVGWDIDPSLEGIGTTFLPQNVGILAEAETLYQGTVPVKLSFTNANQVGDAYGYGSMAYQAARIIRPKSGNPLGAIPTTIYTVLEAAGATAKVITKTITGTATKNTTHFLSVNGSKSLDGTVYSFVVAIGDTAAEIAPKMADALNNVLGCPMVGTVVTDNLVATSLVKGLSSNENNIVIDTGDETAGITYAELAPVAGAGVPSIGTALAQIGDVWVTQLANCIGSDSTVLDALEAFNGTAVGKSGRYSPTLFKPLVSYFGDNLVTTLAEATAITDSRKNEMTNVLCPSPNSLGLSFFAAVDVALIYAPLVQSTPQTDPIGRALSNTPASDSIGDFSDDAVRDQIVKVGSSTVKLNSEKYEIVDLVTTSHPDNEPQTAVLFRWVRDIVGLDFNYRYLYSVLEQIYVVGKTIIPDTSTSTAKNTISPKRWKSILVSQYGPGLVDAALMADLKTFTDSLQVQIGESNPNRFESTFIIQRTGTARVNATTVQTQFKFN